MTDRQTQSESTTVTEPKPSRQKAFGIAALVLGITGVIAGVFSSLFFLAGILGVAGLIIRLEQAVSQDALRNPDTLKPFLGLGAS